MRRRKLPNRIEETRDVLSDRQMMRQIRASERYFAKDAPGLTFEKVFGEPLRKSKKRARRSGATTIPTSPASSPPAARRSSRRKAAPRR